MCLERGELFCLLKRNRGLYLEGREPIYSAGRPFPFCPEKGPVRGGGELHLTMATEGFLSGGSKRGEGDLLRGRWKEFSCLLSVQVGGAAWGRGKGRGPF